jgi:hypothetical protein
MSIYTMDYYVAIKENKIMLFSGKWMGLENIMLSEISQFHRQVACDFFLIWNLGEKKEHESKEVFQVCGRGKGGVH